MVPAGTAGSTSLEMVFRLMVERPAAGSTGQQYFSGSGMFPVVEDREPGMSIPATFVRRWSKERRQWV
jgi:hypothetical protein